MKAKLQDTWQGVLFSIVIAVAGWAVAATEWGGGIGLNPLTASLILGLVLGNTIHTRIPKEWKPGINFSLKQLLRWGIILYGFRITFNDILNVGWKGLLADLIVLTTTFLLGYVLGRKVLKMDRDLTILTASGSSICGAAAVLATEGTLQSEAYKSTVAVATVVTFGTIGMFAMPAIYALQTFIPADFGIYIGSTIHEVAQVVAAGAAISPEVADTAVIVKLTRVMLLAPFLLILSFLLARGQSDGAKRKITIPYFAIGFVVASFINTLDFIPASAKDGILNLDTLLLATAMGALGLETSIGKLLQTGSKPFILALILFAWLIIGGYFVNFLLL